MRNFRKIDHSHTDQHLRGVLGKPFAVLNDRIKGFSTVAIFGYANTPYEDDVTLVTSGLATYARAMSFAKSDGYAQELVLTVNAPYFGDEIIELFSNSLSLYSHQRKLLEWDTPLRLPSPIPGSDGIEFLLPSPAATFPEEFQFCNEPTGLTNFCLLTPLYVDEANWVLDNGAVGIYEAFVEHAVDVADLRRKSIAEKL